MSSSNTAIAATATFQESTLFVQYITSTNTLGTLLALFPSSTPQTGTNNSNTLLYQPQTIIFQGPNPFNASISRLTPSGASMAITSTQNQLTSSYRHDLLLAINIVQPTPPIILKLTRQTSSIGTGPSNSTTWIATDQSTALVVPFNSKKAWITSGTTTNGIQQTEPEGSGLFQLFTTPITSTFQKLDISGSLPSLLFRYLPLNFLDSNSTPKMVRLRNEDEFDVAIVGGCVDFLACVVLINDVGAIRISTDIPYDPTSCIAAANGQIIMASVSGIWTLSYPNMATIWTNRQPPSLLPNLPTPILACAVTNSKLFAVLQGDTQLPTISSIDLRAPSWDWQRVQLTQTTSRDSGGSGDNGLNPIPTSPSDGSNSNSGTKGLSTGIIAAIVAIVVLLLGLGFFCWRRRNTKKSRSNVREIEKAESASASNQGYPPVYEESQRANTSQPAPMPIYINPSTQQAGSWRAQPNKEELSEYGQPNSGQQQPQVSGSWSAASVPTADRSYNHIYQQSHSVYPPSQAGHAPAIATTTTNNATGQYANTPTSSMSSNTFAGDKHELTAEDLMRPGSAASNPFLSPRLPNSPAQSPAIGHVSPNGLHTREMLSPGLTNAQLILQQSQKPQH